MKILIIDGQGGRIGKLLVEQIKAELPDQSVYAVGTNSIATAAMIKGGADQAATGENSVVVCARDADIIVGTIGIAIADSLLGEITPKIACAVGQSKAIRLLLPMNKCNNRIVGMGDYNLTEIINKTVLEIKQILMK